MFDTNKTTPYRVLKCYLSLIIYLQNANKMLTLDILLCQLDPGGCNSTVGKIYSWVKEIIHVNI